MKHLNPLERRTTIAIKGAYGHRNFGDDALMVAAYALVRRAFPSAEIRLLCRNAGYVSCLVRGAKCLDPATGCGTDVDLLVYGGGTQFYSFSRVSRRTPSLLGRIVASARKPGGIAGSIRQKLARTPSGADAQRACALGIGAGPFLENPARIRRAKRALRNMEYVSVRDRSSYELLQHWGCANVSLGSDLCYLPGCWEPLRTSPPESAADPMQKIGVIIRDWPHTEEGNAYAAPLLEVVETLRASGKVVRFLSFAGEYDRCWVQRLREMGEELETWAPERHTIPEFLAALARYDAFISARYHGVVFAAILGKPVVCVELEPKLRLASIDLGEGARLWTYPFVPSQCGQHIGSLETAYEKAREGLASCVHQQGILAAKMADEFQRWAAGNCV